MSKIPEIRADKGDVIGVGVDGNGNIIWKNVNVVINEFSDSCGLTLIHPNFFREHSNTDKEFQKWLKKGFPLSLPSIYEMREYRREEILSKIKSKLNDRNWLLLLGESGTSKTTLLSEIVCDYFKIGHKVLYNFGDDDLRNKDQIVEKIKALVDAAVTDTQYKILVVVDDVHDVGMTKIFSVIKQFDSMNQERKSRVLFLLAARIPEFNRIREKNLFDDYKLIQNIDYLFDDEHKYQVPFFNENEIKGFLSKYKKWLPSSIINRPQISNEIYEYTQGHPIMVCFSVLQNGLRNHAEEMYKTYLLDKVNANAPHKGRIQAFILCALFDLSAIPLSDEILDSLQMKKYATEIRDTIIRKNNDVWITIHPRWDLELLNYMFSLSEETVDDIKYCLALIIDNIIKCKSIVNQKKMSILHNIYYIIAEKKFLDLKIIEEVANYEQLQHEFDKKSKLDFLANIVGPVYHHLNNFDKSLNYFDEALNIDENNVSALVNKGNALSDLALSTLIITTLYEIAGEAEKCYLKVISSNPKHLNALYNLANLYLNIQEYELALKYYEKTLTLNPNDVDALNNAGNCLRGLGRDSEAYDCYVKALKINPVHANALHNMGNLLFKTKSFYDSFNYFDRLSKIQPNNFYAIYYKALSLFELGKNDVALDLLTDLLFSDSSNMSKSYVIEYIFPTWLSKITIAAHGYFKEGRYEEAIRCLDKVIELDPSYANAWYDRSGYMVKKGQINEALKNLEEAIRLEESYFEYVKTDKRFDSIRNDERFRKLIAN